MNNNNEPMTAEQRIRELFSYSEGAELEDRDKPLVALIEAHTEAAVEAAERQWMNDRVRCECSAADACRFARERDEARARISQLEREMDVVEEERRLRSYATKLAMRGGQIQLPVWRETRTND